MKTSVKLASYLLQSKAIIIDPANPFTWASGWTSPIYCDNRKTLSYPEIRDFIRDSFVREILASFKQVDINLEKKTIEVTFEPGNDFTPNARLRIEQFDGDAVKKLKPKGRYTEERGAWVIPLSKKETRVILR